MIVSPRAKPVIDVLRIASGRIIEIDEVFLYRRASGESAYEKIVYWKRGEDNSSAGIGGGMGSCSCEHTTCVILAEADYDADNLTFDHTARILDGEGKPTEEKIQLDHIIERCEPYKEASHE